MSASELDSQLLLEPQTSMENQESSSTTVNTQLLNSLPEEELLELLKLRESTKRKAAGSNNENQDTSAESATKRQKRDGESAELSDNPFLAAISGSSLQLCPKMKSMRTQIQEVIQSQFPDYRWVSIVINMPGMGMPGGRQMPVNIFTSDTKNAAPLTISWGEQIIPQISALAVKKWGGQKAVAQLFANAHPKGSGDAYEGMDWAYTKTFAALNKGEGVTNVCAHSIDSTNTDCHLHVLYGYTSSAFNGTQLAKALTAGQLKPWRVDKHMCSDPALALMNHMEPRTTGVWLGSTNIHLAKLAKQIYDSLKAANITDIPEVEGGTPIEDEVDASLAGFLAPMGSQTLGFTSYQVDNLLSSKTEKFAAKLNWINSHIARSNMETYSLPHWDDYISKLEGAEHINLLHLTCYQKDLIQNALKWYGLRKTNQKAYDLALIPTNYNIEEASSVMEIIMFDDLESVVWEEIYFKVISVIDAKCKDKRNTLWIYGPSNFGKSSVFVDGLSWLGPRARFNINKVTDFQFGNLAHPHSLAVCDDPSGIVIEAIWPTLKAIFAGQSTDVNEKYLTQAKTYPAPVIICSNHPTIDLHPPKTLDVEAFNNRILHINLGTHPCLPECCNGRAQHLLWKWAFVCFEKVKSNDPDRSCKEFVLMLHNIQAFMLFVSRLNPKLLPQVSSLYESKISAFLAPVDNTKPAQLERSVPTTYEEEDDNSLRSGDEQGEFCDPGFLLATGLPIERAEEP